jgi:hypothetical protein
MTWFRREPGIAWIDAAAGTDLDAVARQIYERISA